MAEIDFEIEEEGFDDEQVQIGLNRSELPDNTIFANYTEDKLMIVTSKEGCSYQGMSMAHNLIYDLFKHLNSTRPEIFDMFGVDVEIKDRRDDS